MSESSPTIAPLVISAPFGNYIQPPGATATLGTYTALRRAGRLWRFVSTVRYYRRIGAWVNRIGLRNPGIDSLVAAAGAGRVNVRDKIVSIHGFSDADWRVLLEKVAPLRPLAIELNMSCPNVGRVEWPDRLFEWAGATGVDTIVKLPPVNYALMAGRAVDAGLTRFHCCNTLPVPAGGLSGMPLKPVALQCIRDLRSRDGGDRLCLIGGGGIRDVEDIDDYADAGADRFAIGTRLMNPKVLLSHASIRPLAERAALRAASPESSVQSPESL